MPSFWEIVASNALIVVILAAGVALLGRVWRNPWCLHLLWLLVLLKFVTPPAVIVSFPIKATRLPPVSEERSPDSARVQPSRLQVLSGDTALAGAGPERQPLTAVTRATTSPSTSAPATSWFAGEYRQISYRTTLGGLWALGIGLVVCVRGGRIVRFRRLLRVHDSPSPAIFAMAEDVARRIGLPRVPRICMLPARVSPLVWSLGGRASVFLPLALFERLEASAREAIIAHELAHVRRKDHWTRMLELAVTTLFWWHPVAWWAARRLRELEDQCCDGIVVDMEPVAAKSYAVALLDTLDFLSERPAAAPLGVAAARSSVSMSRRIAMMKNRSWKARWTLRRLIVLWTVAALPMALAFGQKPPQAAGKLPPVGGTGGSQNLPVVQRRVICKQVNEFSKQTDLSTPESAMAAWSRSVARGDLQAILELSWGKLDAETAKDVADELKNASDLSEQFSQKVLDTEIVEVLVYRDDLVAVILKSSLLPAERPYGREYFGRIRGQWRCFDWLASEGLFPSVAAAEEAFEKEKDSRWQSFLKIKAEIAAGRTPLLRPAKSKGRATPSLSSAERADIKRWQSESWQLNVDLDMPNLNPQAVQYAVFDKNPVPEFIAQVGRMRANYRRSLEKSPHEQGREQLREIQRVVAWNLGFKEVTGDRLYLLAKQAGRAVPAGVLSSTGPDGTKWIVTKTVSIKGKPVCWCIPVRVKTGQSVDVTFGKDNTFDLAAAYDQAMADSTAAADDKDP